MTISNGSKVYFWHPASWLRVKGPDAFSLLQGQFTNDLRVLETSPSVYRLWLNQKGRVLADSFVLRGDMADEFWVGSYFCPAEVVRGRLEDYIIADDVAVTDETGDWSGLSLMEPDQIEKARALGQGLIFPGRRGWGGQMEWMTRSPPELAGATMLTTADMERMRIRAALPAIPVDIGPGDLPNEGGLEDEAISSTKGCYLGQEIIARLRSMGQVRRRLIRVTGRGTPPIVPVKLYQDARPVGELRSCIADGESFAGLALLTLLHWQRETPLSLAPDAAPTILPDATS